MKTHRFVGATSREVLHKVKQALGDDALILSNRTHEDGIEVLALSAADIRSADEPAPQAAPAARAVQAAPPAPAAAAPAERETPEAAPVIAPVARAAAAAPVAPAVAAQAAPVIATTTGSAPFASLAPALPANATAAVRSTSSPSVIVPAAVSRFTPPTYSSWAAAGSAHGSAAPRESSASPATPAAPALAGSPAAQNATPRAAADDPRQLDGILSEIQNLKAALQRDIASRAAIESVPASSARAGVMHELLNAGFGAQLSRQVADDVCATDSDPTIDTVAECLERELWVAGADEIINNGGVYALVGPTGVGKTTTVAKIAARAVVRFGASKVALLTTDGFRIGAHDQLRIYGRILSVPVHTIRDAHELATVLAELADRHLILIDTIGMSQRDRMVAEQAAMLAGSGDVKRLLLVQTTANARTLEQVVSAYKRAGVEGCILSKTDEAASIAPALDVVIRHQLPVHYVTDGQRVPEDLQLPDAAALVRDALSPPADDAFDLAPEELPFVLPGMMPRAAAEVSLG